MKNNDMEYVPTYEDDLFLVFSMLQQSGMFRDAKGDPRTLEAVLFVLCDSYARLMQAYIIKDMRTVKALTLTVGASLKYIYGQIDDSKV